MVGTADSLGILDLEQFDKDFAAGKLAHLVGTRRPPKKKAVKEVATKPVLKEYLPSEVVPYSFKVVCACGNETSFLTGYGLRTFYPKSISVTTVTGANEKRFEHLMKINMVGEPVEETKQVLWCASCSPAQFKQEK